MNASRLLTVEFLLYEAIVVLCTVKLYSLLYQASRVFSHSQAYTGAFHLYAGWIPGLQNDLSDIQWRLYRDSLPQLAVALTAWVAVSNALKRKAPVLHKVYLTSSSVALIYVLHGAQAAYVLTSLVAFYSISQRAAGHAWVGPITFWSIPAALWLWARWTDGALLSKLWPSLSFVDNHRGLVRWHISFNLVILRLMSWAYDLHWTRMRRKGHSVGFETNAPSRAYANPPQSFTSLSAKERQLVHHLEPSYELLPFLRYCLYPPLYLTGPTVTYNDFVCQTRCARPTRAVGLLVYGGRVLISLLLLELLTHTLYVNAFMRFKPWQQLDSAVGAVFTPTVIAATAFFKLIFLWLKFLVIWRVARFFALADGIDPPENMLRCVCNNYDISGFWRSWHASFNRWLVRYMYVPMGGNRWRLLNVWPIFTFVAIWHDLELHLLRWAWLMALFFIPEVTCKAIINRPWWRRHWSALWFNHLCASFAAVYITIMMCVNLIGYGVGTGGIIDLMQRVLGSVPLVAGMLAAFYSAAHIMFEIRRLEALGL